MWNPGRIFLAPLKIAGMDDAGELILGTYLNGDGSPIDVRDDPFWTAYMMRHQGLRLQLLGRLNKAVYKLIDDMECRKGLGRLPIVERFHAEFSDNSSKSGYALLHGTNRDAGDFLIVGWAQPTQSSPDGSYRIALDLRYVFNDIVDPNGNYWMDKIQSVAATIVMLGGNHSYRLSIGWQATSIVDVRPDRAPLISGYPSPNMVTLSDHPVAVPGWWTR